MAEEISQTIQNILEEAWDRPVAGLRLQLAERLARECGVTQDQAVARASAQVSRLARNQLAEALHNAIRRLRAASSFTEVAASLLEITAGYCSRTALMVHRGDSLTGWRGCGFAGNGDSAPRDLPPGLQVPLREALAVAQAIDTREPVVTLALADHLSPAMSEAFSIPPEEKVYLFPLSLRQNVVALLYADAVGSREDVQPAALEMLCSVAEACLEILAARRPAAAEPGQLEFAMPRPASRAAPTDWDQMPATERDMHLRAQRFARVLVADLQLYRAQEIREGRKERDLYGHLKEEIDKSRDVYYRKFGQSYTAGIDYFHMELVRTLAGEQEALLGPDYPGPLI